MKIEKRGHDLARGLLEETRLHAKALSTQLGRAPTLAVVAETDAAARKFVGIKQRELGEIGIAVEPVWLDQDASANSARDTVTHLNQRHDIDAIFLQFPLAERLGVQTLANSIAFDKDIDCSSEAAEAAFHQGTIPFTPVAPQAAFDLLSDAFGSVVGRRIAIYGAEDAFFRVLGTLLRRADATVIPPASKQCDAWIISGTVPSPEMLETIASLPLLLDAGYYLEPRAPDWIPQSVASKIDTLLAQYGNVGPLTVAHLSQATLLAAERQLS